MWTLKKETDNYSLELRIFVFWVVEICVICESIESFGLFYRKKQQFTDRKILLQIKE